MHAQGINLRHLGRLRQKVTAKRGRVLLMTMAVTRAFKSRLRKRMRESIQLQEHAGLSSEVRVWPMYDVNHSATDTRIPPECVQRRCASFFQHCPWPHESSTLPYVGMPLPQNLLVRTSVGSFLES